MISQEDSCQDGILSMDSLESQKPRLLAALALAALTSAIGLMLLAPNGPWGDGLARSIYDQALHVGNQAIHTIVTKRLFLKIVKVLGRL